MLNEERSISIKVFPDQIQDSGLIKVRFPRKSRYAGWSTYIDLKNAEVDRTELNSFILSGSRETYVVIFDRCGETIKMPFFIFAKEMEGEQQWRKTKSK